MTEDDAAKLLGYKDAACQRAGRAIRDGVDGVYSIAEISRVLNEISAMGLAAGKIQAITAASDDEEVLG